MNLDFFTLYVIILLNSLTLAIVWAAICHAYRAFEAARYWLASCILTTFGGCLLALEVLPYGKAFTVAGNACVVHQVATRQARGVHRQFVADLEVVEVQRVRRAGRAARESAPLMD